MIDGSFEVGRYVRYLAQSLGRVIECEGATSTRVVQRCPICEAELVVWLPRGVESGDALCRHLFSLYDDHRCVIRSVDVADQRARADAAAEQMAIRAAELRKREAVEPPTDLPSLYERAEREAVLLGEWAARF